MNDLINERLKSIRTTLSLTQEEFGKILGFSKTAIWSYEKGTRSIPERFIKSVCHEFNVSYNYIKYGTGPKSETPNKVDDAFSYLATFYKLNSVDIDIIKSYLTMSTKERSAFSTFITTIANASKQ